MQHRSNRTATPWGLRTARVIASLLLIVMTPMARAQSEPIEVQASFSQTVCYLGDEIVFQIAVENADSVEPPDLSAVEGATFRYGGISNESRTMVSVINGRRSEEITKRLVMRWAVAPTQRGTLVIPPQLIKANASEVVTSGEAQIRVLEPERPEGDLLRVEIEEGELYVNQPTVLTVTWMLIADITDFSFRGSDLDEGIQVRTRAPAAQGRARQYEIDVFGIQTVGRLTYATHEGERVRAMQFQLLVTPTRAGTFEVGPISVSYDQVVSRRSTTRMLAEAEPIELTVRELPSEGKPEGFFGLLGTHAIEANASTSVVNVGDPITLEIAVYGPEPMAPLRDGPDLSEVPAFAEGFRMSSEGWTMSPTRKPGERRFTTTVRASDSGVTEIPAIPLPFFDLESGRYRIARSEPIPLKVRAVREITAADAVVSAGPSAVSRESLQASGPGLWAIETGPSVLATNDGLGVLDFSNPVILAGLTVPPACFSAVLGVITWRSRRVDEAQRRRNRALASARGVLRSEGPAQAVRVYLAHAFDATPSAITGEDGRRLLQEAGVDDAGTVTELITIEEADRFGRSPGEGAPDSTRVLDLLKRVDRQRRTSEGGVS